MDAVLIWDKYMSSSPPFGQKLVTVFGGSGFLGRHVVRALAAQGYSIRVACRRPDLAGHLQPLGNVGQIQYVQANLRYQWSIDRAVEGADAVINLVGILGDNGKQTFDTVHVQGAAGVAKAAKADGASLVHISTLGADGSSAVKYYRSKAEGEQVVLEQHRDAIILRPSIVFGAEDGFFNRFAALASISPILPLIGGGQTRLQPVYVGDIALAVTKAVKGTLEVGSVWELGGSEVLSFKQCMEQMLDVIGRERSLMKLPYFAANFVAFFVQFFPGAPLTPNQVEMLKVDRVVLDRMKEDGKTLEGMGIDPTLLSSILPRYLVRFRKHGQYEANHG